MTTGGGVSIAATRPSPAIPFLIVAILAGLLSSPAAVFLLALGVVNSFLYQLNLTFLPVAVLSILFLLVYPDQRPSPAIPLLFCFFLESSLSSPPVFSSFAALVIFWLVFARDGDWIFSCYLAVCPIVFLLVSHRLGFLAG
ncbi:unnamed protein product [Spirodela intermedia]|uniref:Uncharacterized protein n=1 Tax=Spirodela intermedia TaxID=51605 RepID=A0A7I8JG65_SPIIN|nr:unnamed protein product [Spirodela intermedia]CAA6669147.1 unnamed protein product [Spirodela intermedia]